MAARARLVVLIPAFGLVVGAGHAGDVPGTRVATSLSEPLDLAGPWRFHPGDDRGWADPALDDSSWPLLVVPGDWGRRGYAGTDYGWYRLTVLLPRAAAGADAGALAVAVGRVHSAYELYAGGRLVGALGRFPPDPETRYDREALFGLPRSAVGADGRLVLALRVWRGGRLARPWQGGPDEGRFALGPPEALAARAWRDRLLSTILAALYLAVGVYHIHLYRRRRALGEYLWYGLLAMAVGAYTLLISPWKHEAPFAWFTAKKLEYAVLFLLAPLALWAIFALVDLRPGRLLRAYRASFLALAAAALLAPDLLILFHTLDLWRLWILPCVFGLAGLVAVKAARGHAEARTVLSGVLAFALTALNDLAVDDRVLRNPRLVSVGFLVFILSMAVSLSNRFTRVFTELEARTRELQRAQAELVRTEKLSAIGSMAAGLVHDLRNPVAAIQSYATLLAEKGTPEQKELLQRIRDETSRSVDMMEDVLAFARGSVHVQPRTLELGAWLEELRGYLQRDLELAGVEVALAGELEGEARLDPGRLRRVLCNLAWNAKDALLDGGRFEIAVRRSPGWLEIACQDDGPGVPAAFQPRLFGEFATFGKANGTGLGLALSRAIVLEHGGTITYEDAPGGGARFVLRLPQPEGLSAPGAPGAARAATPGRTA